MSKIAIITDTHFGVRGNNRSILKAQLRFFEDTFFPYLNENGITSIIHLGDLFDNRKSIDIDILTVYRKMVLKRLRDYDEMVFVMGNHDTYYRTSNKVNAPVQMRLLPKDTFIVSDSVKEMNLYDREVLFVPWIPNNPDARTKILQKISDWKGVVMGHFQIAGFEMQRGNICMDGLSQDLFQQCSQVLSGHFHQKSKIGHIQYLGAPYQMTWADAGCARGFHVWDTETLELEFIPNEDELFVSLNYSPKEQDPIENLAGKYVKVTIRGDRDKGFDKYMDKINAMFPESVSVIDTTIIQTRTQKEVKMKSTRDMMLEYIDNLELEDGRRDRLIKEFDEVYSDCLSMDRE